MQALDRLALAGRLSGGLAHNLRNHLAGVRAMLDWCRRQEGGEPQVTAALGNAATYLDQADELIRAILGLASGRDVAPAAVDERSATAVAEVVADLLLLVQHADARAWRVRLQVPPDLPLVAVPRAVLLDVLLNLALNAFDALRHSASSPDAVNPATDDLCIAATWLAVADGDRDGGRCVEIRVIDHGPGLAPEVAATLFDPGSTTRADGHGLGLWMVRQQVESLGGTVHAEATPGGGATFVLRLPESRAARPMTVTAATAGPTGPESLAADPPVPAVASPGTVLLVEDDALLRFCIAEHLEGCGWRVIVERDGDAALARCRDVGETLDLVIADYVVPGRHGTALVEAVRATRPALPILAISAWPEGHDVADLLAHGASDFLAKPFALEKLDATARSLVARQL